MRVRLISSFLFAFIAWSTEASAQTGCGGEYVGCTSAPIRYRHREALPGKFNFDTNWVPGGSPVQVRIQALFAGNTQVDLNGSLVGSWPTPMSLTVAPTMGGGTIAVDYGVQLNARVRLALDTGITTVRWEGAIPYIPMIDFRAMASSTFEPWAWSRTSTRGMTMRQRVADVSLTDAIIRIPGISGGFTLDAAAEVEAGYRSTRFTFGTAADPITAMTLRTQAAFTAGAFVEYQPVLEGELDYTVSFRLFPSLYVRLVGRTWSIGLPEIPINLGPFPHDIDFDPAVARLGLPDIEAAQMELDFGEVTLGRTEERFVSLRNVGEGDGRLLSVSGDGPFGSASGTRMLPARSRSELAVTFMPVTPGSASGTVVINTNDPDNPRLRVAVRGIGVAPIGGFTDAGVTVDGGELSTDDGGVATDPTGMDDGSCGCAVPGRTGNVPGGMAALLVIGVWGAARRCRRTAVWRPKTEKIP